MGVTLGKMGYTLENGSHLEKWSQFLKWVKLGEMGQSWENGSQLVKRITLWKSKVSREQLFLNLMNLVVREN